MVKTEEASMVRKWTDGKIIQRIKTIGSARGTFDNDIETPSQPIRRVVKKKVLETPIENLVY